MLKCRLTNADPSHSQLTTLHTIILSPVQNVLHFMYKLKLEMWTSSINESDKSVNKLNSHNMKNNRIYFYYILYKICSCMFIQNMYNYEKYTHLTPGYTIETIMGPLGQEILFLVFLKLYISTWLHVVTVKLYPWAFIKRKQIDFTEIGENFTSDLVNTYSRQKFPLHGNKLTFGLFL